MSNVQPNENDHKLTDDGTLENPALKDPSTAPKPNENTGMEMGTQFEEEKEQDLDELIHRQGSLKKDEIPPPDES